MCLCIVELRATYPETGGESGRGYTVKKIREYLTKVRIYIVLTFVFVQEPLSPRRLFYIW